MWQNRRNNAFLYSFSRFRFWFPGNLFTFLKFSICSQSPNFSKNLWFQPLLSRPIRQKTPTKAPITLSFVRVQASTMSNWGNWKSLAFMLPRTRTWTQLWVENCAWEVLTDSIETTSIWTESDNVNKLTNLGKYTNFSEFEIARGGTSKRPHCFDNFDT